MSIFCKLCSQHVQRSSLTRVTRNRENFKILKSQGVKVTLSDIQRELSFPDILVSSLFISDGEYSQEMSRHSKMHSATSKSVCSTFQA